MFLLILKFSRPFSPLAGPNFSLSTRFSFAVNVCSSINEVSCQYKTKVFLDINALLMSSAHHFALTGRRCVLFLPNRQQLSPVAAIHRSVKHVIHFSTENILVNIVTVSRTGLCTSFHKITGTFYPTVQVHVGRCSSKIVMDLFRTEFVNVIWMNCFPQMVRL